MNYTNQISWPVQNLLANPDIIIPIATRLGIGNWEALYKSFYLLLEHEMAEVVEEVKNGEHEVEDEEDLRELFNWESEEVTFIYNFEESIIQVYGDSGVVIQLEESEGGHFTDPVVERGERKLHSGIRNSDEFQISSTLYQGFIEQIENAVPDLKGDIVLCDPPVPSNNYLRDEETDNFTGQFHLISDPSKKYNFSITVNTDDKESKATVTEVKDGE